MPHSVAITVESMKRDPETDKAHIRVTVMVEYDSQKGITTGKQGAVFEKIGRMTRRDIEVILGDKIYLRTWVRVRRNWHDKKLNLADFGYNEKEYQAQPRQLCRK